MECNSNGKFELSLSNFQSVSKATLEFEKGINLIVGQSNSGKSATLRAVKATVLNTSGAHRFIKQGTEESNVTIKYKNNDIKWHRTKKESKYTVNNEEYIKVGNSNLFKILEDNGFVVDDKNNLMNIEGELELPFPFDRSSAELFKLFENVFCVSDSATILKAIKEEEDKNTREKGNIADDLTKVNLKLSALDALEEEVDLVKLKNGKEVLSALDKEQNKLKLDVDLISNTNNLINNLNLGTDETVKNFTLTNLVTYSKLVKDLNGVLTTKKLLALLKSDAVALEVNQDNLSNYLKMIADFDKLSKSAKLNKLDLKDMDISTDSVSKFESLTKDYNKLVTTEKLLKLVKEVKEATFNDSNVLELDKVKTDFDNLNKLKSSVKTIKDSLAIEKQKLDEIELQLSEYKTCPLCGSNIGE